MHLLYRGKFCTVSYWMLRQIYFFNLHVQRMGGGIGVLEWDTQGKLVLSSNAAFSWQCPIEIIVRTVEELCPHPRVRRGLTNFCDTEFSAFLKGWVSRRWRLHSVGFVGQPGEAKRWILALCFYCLPQFYITFVNNKLLLIAAEQCISLTLILMVF